MKFYQKPWFAWICYILFFPLGLFLLFYYNHHDKSVRYAALYVAMFFFILNILF